MASSSYIQLINKIQAFCDAHDQVERFDAEFGEQRPNLATESEKYPYVFLEPNSVDGGYDLRNFSITITCYDIIQKDRANVNTIVSDCEQILQDLFSYFNQGKDADIIALSNSKTPLNNYDLDYVAGWSMDIVFELEGWCTDAIPMTPIVPPSGGDCEDANYNLNDSAGANISSGSIASGATADITAPDGEVRVKKSDGVLISAEAVKSDESKDYLVADSTVENSTANYSVNVKATDGLTLPDTTVNVDNGGSGTVPSIDAITIAIEDTNGAVTPISETFLGSLVTIEVPASGGGLDTESAKLIKTGQTTSYRTGDDGDLENGRATNFTTLPANNPFGNTNRFTDVTGAQTYTLGIVLDWSTYDGSTVLGYTKAQSASTVNWNTSIDNALLTSIGTYTTGWSMTNDRELLNLANRSVVFPLNYAPFNITYVVFWTSTTNPANTANAFYLNNNNGQLLQISKAGGSAKYLARREFTNAELGI